MDQSNRYANLTLKEADLIAGGRHGVSRPRELAGELGDGPGGASLAHLLTEQKEAQLAGGGRGYR